MRYFNIAYIVGGFFVLFLYCICQIYVGNHVDFLAITSSYFLGISLFLLPDYLQKKYPHTTLWILDPALSHLIAIILFAGLGIVFFNYSIILQICISVLGGFLLVKYLQYIFKTKSSLLSILLVLSIYLVLFFITLSTEYTSFFFKESVVVGGMPGAMDTLFHAALSNILASYHVASTGLDGLPHIHYHWLSHLLGGGFSAYFNNNSLLYYNVVYPLIFIPFLLKIIDLSSKRLLWYYNLHHKNSFFLFVAVLVFFLFFPFLSGSYLFIIPSYTFSIIFGLCLFSFLLSQKNIFNRPLLLILISIILVALSFTKVSTGFIFTVFLGYIALRNSKKVSHFLILLGLSSAYLGIIYFYFLKIRESNYSDTNMVELLNYYSLFLKFSDHILDFFIGLLIALLLVLFSPIFNGNMRNLFFQRKTVFIEALAIANIMCLMIGLALIKQHPMDSLNFLSVFIFLCIPFCVLLLSSIKIKPNLSINPSKLIACTFVVIFVVTNYRLIRVVPIHYKTYTHFKTHHNTVLFQYLSELENLNTQIKNKEDYCIFIEKNQNWYYQSLYKHPHLQKYTPFITPAFVGISHIAGIFESTVGSKSYGFNFYEKDGYSDQINLKQALHRAKQKGFKKMLYYYEKDGKLKKVLFSL